nr:MAG TPA: hypothetical protein [Caudoviricetes sp.]
MKLEKNFIQVSGRCFWQERTYETAYSNFIPKEFFDKMGEAMYATKGKVNNQLGLELVVAGIPTELIKQVIDAAEDSKYYYNPYSDGSGFVYDKYTRVIQPNEKQRKKNKGYYNPNTEKQIPYKETLIGRKLRETFGEELLTQKFEGRINGVGVGVFDIYNDKTLIRATLGNLRSAMSSALPLYMYFSKFDDEKQKAILNNKTLSTLLLERTYSENVPRDLADECISTKTFLKTQVELFLEELYSLTQIEEGLAPLDITKNSYTADRYNTLSEVGFTCSKITDLKMWVMLLAAAMNLEKIGLTIYHKSTGRIKWDSDAKRGYKRLLQKINKSHTEYLKLINKGFSPDVARTTVLEQLKFWVSDWKNTDSYWFIRKIKGWQGQETDKQEQVETKSKSKTKSTKTLKLKPTIEDINKILSKKEGEEENGSDI